MQGRFAAMTEHRLRPLLEPRSIALVGASARPDSFGYATLRNLASPHYRGGIHAVNPRYDRIDDIDCHPSLGDIPGGVEHAVLSVANARIEAALVDAVEAGVRSVTIFGSAYLEGDTAGSNLKDRLEGIAREAGLLVIGANCMGFVNYTTGARVTWMNVPEDGWFDPGHITLISHSGTCFLTLQFVDPRHRHNLCISAGQELTVTAADYIDYALDKESTRVIALFLETVRDPDAFRAALDRAARSDVPVVAIKVGRTDRSAELARSHSGALAGNDAAYEAVFDHYGVLRVDTWNELAAASRLFAHHKEIAPGGLAGIMDSGGARGMLLDLAARMCVPFADIGEGTVKTLSGLLEYGLEPVNPTDVWGSGRDWQDVYTGSMKALADDPASAMTGIFADLGGLETGGSIYLELCEKIERETAKPVFFCQHWSRAMDPEMTRKTAASPVLVIDGTETFLAAVRLAMQRRDREEDSPGDMAPVPEEPVIERWRQRLAGAEALDENEGLALLESFGIAAPARRMAASADECAAAAVAIGWPVVLKTATAGLLHKTDVAGVILSIDNEDDAVRAWRDLAERLGPRVLVEAMAPRGIEMAAGIVIDRQFGPLVMIAAGGVLIETHADRRFLLPPSGRTSVRRAIDQLACRPLLDGARGSETTDIDALIDAVARLSVIATTLGDRLAELDINPLIVHPRGCLAVDALVIPRTSP
ncbi:MAG: acetate--CoA ligase family protein [bacterium]|nr:acetate--CoA ligase family protein [bacterium]